MNEPIAVEARFETDGTIRPLAFLWKGKRYLVASLGRQWEVESERHFLVMTPNEKVYELVYRLSDGCWRLRRQPRDFKPPRSVV